MTATILVEDRGVLGMIVSDYLNNAAVQLAPYGLDGTVHLFASGQGLRKWLDQAAAATVRMVLLDYAIVGGSSVAELKQLSAHGRPLHRALSPNAMVIGWSAEPNSAPAFHSAAAAGFISKYRPISQIVADIVFIAAQRQAGQAWLELPPDFS